MDYKGVAAVAAADNRLVAGLDKPVAEKNLVSVDLRRRLVVD